MRLGWLFLRRSDKQAWFRYVVMIVAIAFSTAALFSSMAIGNAIYRQFKRGEWAIQLESSGEKVRLPLEPEKIDYRGKTLVAIEHDYFGEGRDGARIQEIGIRQMSDGAPLPVGLDRQPETKEVFVSPKLKARMEEDAILRERYAEYKVKVEVPEKFLTSPDDYVAIYKLSEERLARKQDRYGETSILMLDEGSLKNTYQRAETGIQRIINIFMLLCGLGVCFPMLTLLISAMRIGMVQREKRYAALSLIGTSKMQLNQIILAEALSSTGIGVGVGFIIYEILRGTILRELAFNGGKRFFFNDIAVTGWREVGIVALIFMIVIIVNLIAMRKVKSSPLGVAKIQKMPRKATVLRLLPLLVAVIAIMRMNQLGGEWLMKHGEIASWCFMGTFLLIMVGILTVGPFFTRIVAVVIEKVSNRMMGLMVGKRLKIFAKTIFASVSGVVLALFVSSFFLAMMASVEKTYIEYYGAENKVIELNKQLNRDDTVKVMVARSEDEVFEQAIAKNETLKNLIKAKLRVKILVNKTEKMEAETDDYIAGGDDEVYTCRELVMFTLAKCENGLKEEDRVVLKRKYQKEKYEIERYEENEKQEIKPVRSIMMAFENKKAAEEARKYLQNIGSELRRETGIMVQVERPMFTIFDVLDSVKWLMDLIKLGTALTIIVAGMSAAVATIGGLFERKKSFMDLRLMGVGHGTLCWTVLWESVVPLMTTAGMAVLAGGMTAKYLGRITTNEMMVFAWPKGDFWWLVIGAIGGAIGIVAMTLPILKQITALEGNRRE